MYNVKCSLVEFICMKAYYNVEDGTRVNTFTTFFQRYSDDDILWMSAGDTKSMIMYTPGGMKLNQIHFLILLLNEKEIRISADDIFEYNLNCPENVVLKI